MTLTLVGKPTTVIERGPCVITLMQTNQIPALPKGIPAPTQATTIYAVYMRTKQWRKVAPVITDPQAMLIVEGIPHLDLQMRCIAVFTTSIKIKMRKPAEQTRETMSPQFPNGENLSPENGEEKPKRVN